MKAYRRREGSTPHVRDRGMRIDSELSALESDRPMNYMFIYSFD
jgi:hypothetical protein